MGTRKMHIAAPCPACNEPTLEYTAADMEVPYFGAILQTVFICSSCGFRHADVIIGKNRQPQRTTFRTQSDADMSVRVVRSTSGTVRIPELGVLIEPGPASESFVSNIEGILVRVEAVVGQLMRDAETPAETEACQDRLAAIARAKTGRDPVTLILEDPYGNSTIIDDRATTEPIPQAEADLLPRGEISLDVSDVGLEGSDADGHRNPQK